MLSLTSTQLSLAISSCRSNDLPITSYSPSVPRSDRPLAPVAPSCMTREPAARAPPLVLNRLHTIAPELHTATGNESPAVYAVSTSWPGLHRTTPIGTSSAASAQSQAPWPAPVPDTICPGFTASFSAKNVLTKGPMPLATRMFLGVIFVMVVSFYP